MYQKWSTLFIFIILVPSLVTSSQPSIIVWKEEGGLFGCYHCLVMLLPAGKGGNLVFLAFVQLYFSAAQTSISLFCSIVFVWALARLLFTVNYGILNQWSIVVLHQWHLATYSFMFQPFASEITFLHWQNAVSCLLVALSDMKSGLQINQSLWTLKIALFATLWTN